MTGLLLLVWCLHLLKTRTAVPLSLSRLWFVITPFFLALGWAWLQTSAVLPVAWHHPIWRELDQALGNGLGIGAIAGSVSIDPEMTDNALLRLGTYAGVFLLAAQLGRERSRARTGLLAVLVGYLAYAIYGLTVYFSGNENILWFMKWAYRSDLTSSFVNRNAYAAYAGMGVICCVALFIHALRETQKRTRAFDLAEAVLKGAVPYLMAATLIGASLLLAHSRGATIMTSIALIATLGLSLGAGLLRARVAALSGGVILLIGLGSVLIGGEGVAQRFSDGITDPTRLDIYRLSMTALLDAPLTGHGLGSFEPAFRIYRDTSLPETAIIDLAHNVHLETLMDMGFVGAGLLYLSFAAILVVCLIGLRVRRRDQIYPLAALGCAILIGGHGFVDFSAQMPAVAINLAFLFGLGYAQSWRTGPTAPNAPSIDISPEQT